MSKRILIGLLAVIIFASIGGCSLLTQRTETETPKVYRVGILNGLDFFADTADGFKTKMSELGYEEGKNIFYDLQKSNFDIAAYDSILKKFVNDKVDLILTFPTEASQEAKAATQGTNIPVVFTNAFIEDTNLVNSVREPGGNITGVRWAGPDIAIQRFEAMRELAPQAKRMWLPYQKGYPIVKSQLEALRPVFAEAGITLTELPANDAAELGAELQKQADSFSSTDAILLISEPLAVTPDAFIVLGKFAAEHKIPVGGALMSAGGYESLFGMMPQGVPQGKQAAVLADKIFRGSPAGAIPVVSADVFFQLNYKEAQRLGLNVGENLLNKANQIIR